MAYTKYAVDKITIVFSDITIETNNGNKHKTEITLQRSYFVEEGMSERDTDNRIKEIVSSMTETIEEIASGDINYIKTTPSIKKDNSSSIFDFNEKEKDLDLDTMIEESASDLF